MIRTRPSPFWLLPLFGLIVFLDECAKFWALQNAPDEKLLRDPDTVSLAVHKNLGIAFDIPFKMPLVITASVAIGLVLLWVAYREVNGKPLVSLAALMIVLGAAGNVYDRLAYGYTVDYLIFFRRSAINISDIVIVAGVVLLLYASRDHANAHDHTLDKDSDS